MFSSWDESTESVLLSVSNNVELSSSSDSVGVSKFSDPFIIGESEVSLEVLSVFSKLLEPESWLNNPVNQFQSFWKNPSSLLSEVFSITSLSVASTTTSSPKRLSLVVSKIPKSSFVLVNKFLNH